MTIRLALLTAAALAAALAALALSRWGTPGNRDPVSIAREVQRGDELGAHLETARRRDEAKRALAAEVLAGRLTVREAADHFRSLNDAASDYPASLPRLAGREWALHHEVLDWAWGVVAHLQRYAAAARWYAEAFTTDPQLLAGPPSNHRYHAACAAAMAGCGRGRDADDLDQETRAGFRRQALRSLRAELEARCRLLEQEPETARQTVANDLQDWLWDTPISPGCAGGRP